MLAYKISPVIEVRNAWQRYLFLKDMKLESRGWLNDVLSVVRKIKRGEFSLSDVYSYENELKALHPKNLHVRDKIRQQLQFLRDEHILVFLGNGKYRLLM